jgi:hypothetical protein
MYFFHFRVFLREGYFTTLNIYVALNAFSLVSGLESNWHPNVVRGESDRWEYHPCLVFTTSARSQAILTEHSRSLPQANTVTVIT